MIVRERDSAHLRVWLLGTFYAERRNSQGIWEEIKKVAWGNSYARSFFQRLLCASDRRAARSDIIEDLWPERSFSLAEQYLNNSSSKLAKILQHESLFKSFGPHGTSGYELAGQALLWTDISACEMLMCEAECSGRTSTQALPLLEQACKYFDRGSALAGEGGQWCLAIRTEQENAMRCCRIWLAEAYEAHHMPWNARIQYRKLLDSNPLDEDILCRLLALLCRQNMTYDAAACYAQAKKRFASYNLSVSQETEKLAERLFSTSFSIDAYLTPQAVPPSSSRIEECDEPYVAQTSSLRYNDVQRSFPLPNGEMLMRSRRQTLQDLLQAACTTMAFSPYAFLPAESQDRFLTILKHPSYIDERALEDLDAITLKYWRLSKNASVDILSGITGHFTDITRLLRGSHPQSIYEKLCILLGKNALLLGKTFHDVREFDLAEAYYKFTLKIAQDMHSLDLWASCIGRIALMFMYRERPERALPFLQEAQTKNIHDLKFKPWLAAIEAECYAMMGHDDACRRSLEKSKSVTLLPPLDQDFYYETTEFNPSRTSGYEGACYLKLRKPELALPALKQAFELRSSAHIRSQSMLLADIGTVYAQLGNMEKACGLFQRALDATEQTKSLIVLQRVYKGRKELDNWESNPEVKALDDRVSEVFTTLTKLREA